MSMSRNGFFRLTTITTLCWIVLLYAITIAPSFAFASSSSSDDSSNTLHDSSSSSSHDRFITQQQHTNDHRDLQSIDLLCNLLGSSLPSSNSGCSCSFNLASLGNIGFDFQCHWIESTCFILLCAIPTFSGSIELLTGTSSIELCYTGGTMYNTLLPEFCVNLMGTTILNDFEDISPDHIVYPTNNDLTSSSSIQPAKNSITSCTAHVESTVCNSCTPCDDGRGILFDCTNIHPLIKQSQCSDFNLPQFNSRTSFDTSTKKLIILPKLDPKQHSQ